MSENGKSAQITSNSRAQPISVAGFLKDGTQALHAEAERSGVIADLLKGRISRHSYALLLRNLVPVYRALEGALDGRRANPIVAAIGRPPLYRSAALQADLTAIAGSDWDRTLALLPAGETYAQRIAQVADGDGSLLIAHAYVRYLGDLNGGQVLKRLLANSLGLGSEALSFYEFPGIADLAAFKQDYRAAFDAVDTHDDELPVLVEEARLAFRLNIALSEAVAEASRPRD